MVLTVVLIHAGMVLASRFRCALNTGGVCRSHRLLSQVCLRCVGLFLYLTGWALSLSEIGRGYADILSF